MSRDERLREAYAALDARLRAACRAADRDAEEITVVAVSKTVPATDVAILAGLGHRDFGENRHQEAAAKVAALVELAPSASPDLTWHFVGQLQTNKARAVARYADVVHSVDRTRLVHALAAGARQRRHRLDVLLQISLGAEADEGAGGASDDGEPARGGVHPDHVEALATTIAGCDTLRLAGVMAVARRDRDPVEEFTQVSHVAARLRAHHPEARWISAGMSGDLEAAVAAGATHLRVGTALFGGRAGPLG